jgi:hypothetical protein
VRAETLTAYELAGVPIEETFRRLGWTDEETRRTVDLMNEIARERDAAEAEDGRDEIPPGFNVVAQ